MIIVDLNATIKRDFANFASRLSKNTSRNKCNGDKMDIAKL